MEDSALLLLVLFVLLVALFLMKLTNRSNKKIVHKQTAASTTTTVATVVFDILDSHAKFLENFQLCLHYHLSKIPFQVIDGNGGVLRVATALQKRETFLRERVEKHDQFAYKQVITYLHGLHNVYLGMSRNSMKVITLKNRALITSKFQMAFTQPTLTSLTDIKVQMESFCDTLCKLKPNSASTIQLTQAFEEYSTALYLYVLDMNVLERFKQEYEEYLKFLQDNITTITLFD